MSYVKTVDKIFEVDKGFENFLDKPTKDMCFYDETGWNKEWHDAYFIGGVHHPTGWIKIKDFVAQAESLKDLFDEFDVIIKGKHHHYYDFKQVEFVLDRIEEEKAFIDDECIEKADAVYGAIWTPKGLMYAAIMIDNRKFKLL